MEKDELIFLLDDRDDGDDGVEISRPKAVQTLEDIFFLNNS